MEVEVAPEFKFDFGQIQAPPLPLPPPVEPVNRVFREGQIQQQDPRPYEAGEVEKLIHHDRFCYNFSLPPLPGSIINNMYVIPKSSLGPGEWETHRRILTIVPTPSFFERKQQKMFGSKPKPFLIYGEDATHCAVPIQYGLLYFGLPERDLRFDGYPLNLDYKAGALWGKDEGNYDQVAMDEAIQTHVKNWGGNVGGQESAPTGSGKTKVNLFQASKQRLNKRFIFVCHSRATLAQNRLVLQECFGPDIRIATIQGGYVDIPDCDCALASLKTLSLDNPDGRYLLKPEQLKQFGMVIWDEVHLTAAPEMQKAYAKLSQIKLHFGVSGTVKRKDDMDVLFDIWLGPMFFKGPQETRVSKYIDCYALQYHAGAKEERHKKMRTTGKGGMDVIPDHVAMIERMMFDNRRNALLLFLCDLVLKLGFSTLYFHDRVPHIKQMAQELQKRYPDKKIVFVTGSTPDEEVEKYRVERQDLVLGTHKKLATGSDFLHANCVIEACPYGDTTTSNQSTGRLRFKKQCETEGLRMPIFHVVDEFSIFRNQFARCKSVWKLKKFVIASGSKITSQEFWDKDKNLWCPQIKAWIENLYTPEEVKRMGPNPFEMSTPLVLEEKKKRNKRKGANKGKKRKADELEAEEEVEAEEKPKRKKRKAETKPRKPRKQKENPQPKKKRKSRAKSKQQVAGVEVEERENVEMQVDV